MYVLCISSVILSAVVYTNAAVGLYMAQEKPEEFANLEGCYLEHLKKVIPYGDYYPEKSCVKYTCDKDNITQVFSCGAVHVDRRCSLISNEEANYPDCCPHEVCGTISPEYFTQEENQTEESREETKTPAKSEGGTERFEDTSEKFVTIRSVAKSPASEGNEILIAEANSNVAG